MLQELTRDAASPTLAVLGSRKVAVNSWLHAQRIRCSERYNAVDLLRSIIPNIRVAVVVVQPWLRVEVRMQAAWMMRCKLQKTLFNPEAIPAPIYQIQTQRFQ